MAKRVTLADVLRRAIRDSGENLMTISAGSGIANPILYRFAKGQRDLTLRVADRLMNYLGLEIRQKGR